MRLFINAVVAGLMLAFGVSASAALLDAPVPDNATVIQGSGKHRLQWAWASPVAGDGSFGAGAVDLSFQGALGWRIPTAADLARLPSALDFVFAGANVPSGGTDPVSGANFHFGSPGGDAACAAPYFNGTYLHCDWENAPSSGGSNIVPWWPDTGFVDFSESLVVRGLGVPEPTSLALLGLGIAGLGFSRRNNRR